MPIFLMATATSTAIYGVPLSIVLIIQVSEAQKDHLSNLGSFIGEKIALVYNYLFLNK